MNNNDYLKICQFARLISRAERTKCEVYFEYLPHVDILQITIYNNGFANNGYEKHEVNCFNTEKVKAMAKYFNKLYLKLVVNNKTYDYE